MRIVLAGGGTGGHFYPIIAVAQAIREISEKEKLIEPELYYLASEEYDKQILFDLNIKFKKIYAGKMRRYGSILNIFDYVKTMIGAVITLFQMFIIFPDIVFSKGAYMSFPVVFAARLLGIPVIIHESDSKPGRVNAWAGKFAYRVAVSYPSAIQYFPADKVAHTGNPIRKEILYPAKEGAREYFGLSEDIPIILILGGSQGAQKINDAILMSIAKLTESYYIIHQTGKLNFKDVEQRGEIILAKSQFRGRYKPYPYLDLLGMRYAGGVTNLVVSRAGSTIFEIANWVVPSIIIPISEEVSHDQKNNAFSFARSGSAVVIEEKNLTPSILLSEIKRILDSDTIQETMKQSVLNFQKKDAAETIARELLRVGVNHE